MQTLKFLGRGSAFNTKEGNASAYIKQDNHLLLIDCGEDIFERIMKANLLDGIGRVDVLITHLNSDHVGSLSSLIYYCYYIKKFKVNVYFPTSELKDLLKLMGHDGEYKFIELKENEIFNIVRDLDIIPLKTNHITGMSCYGYYIYTRFSNIYYSGDSSVFEMDCFDLSVYDEIYQDTCSADYEGNVHLSLKKLCEAVPIEYRNKVYCMHIDKDELIDKAKAEGFNVVELA